MQIDKITANNFKSLVDFKLDLAKFTCLIGLNGAGKSTVLQCIDFLSQQVRGDIKGWLRQRNWSAKEIKSHFSKKRNIDFSVQLSDSSDDPCSWEASFNIDRLHCTTERIRIGGAELHVHDGQFEVVKPVKFGEEAGTGTRSAPDEGGRILFDYEGSILSQLREFTLPAPLLEFKHHLQSVKGFDVLAPQFLRQRTRASSESLGLAGQGLSALLHQLGAMEREAIVHQLENAFGQLISLETKSLNRGWKKLDIQEEFNDKKVVTDARHIADGVLRLVAILAELRAGHRLLLFDEIENGINPELVEFVLDILVNAPEQVVVTTHSPMILNYLEDDIARKGVMYVYKTSKGDTKAIRFFDIPSLITKLTVMGPGEVFADTNLTALIDEIESVTEGQ